MNENKKKSEEKLGAFLLLGHASSFPAVPTFKSQNAFQLEIPKKARIAKTYPWIFQVELLFTPKKGGTPRRDEIVFISPTGEEIKNKRQLSQFLKAHPEQPTLSEFDWGTGDTPRRSSRISQKSKATETPEDEPDKKREKKSSSKKGKNEKKDSSAEEDEVLKESGAETTVTDAEEGKINLDAKMKDVDAAAEKIPEKVGEDEASKEKECAPTADAEETKTEEPVDVKKVSSEEVGEGEKPITVDAEGKTSLDTAMEVDQIKEKSSEVAPEVLVGENNTPVLVEEKESEVQESSKEGKTGEEAPAGNSELKDGKDANTKSFEDGQHRPKPSSVNC